VKRLSLLVLLFCLAVSTAQGQAEEMKAYENDTFGFYVTCPQTWRIDPDEANGYFALYSPEALTKSHYTLDLVSGLKMEILPKNNKELANFLSRNDLRQKVKGSNQYFFRDSDCYYLFTVIKGSKWNFLIIGYFPEKKKEALYVPQYQKVVNTLTLI
jgi:hypothetical protein